MLIPSPPSAQHIDEPMEEDEDLQDDEDTGRQKDSKANEPFVPSGKGSFDLDLEKHVPSDLSHSPPEDISPSREKALQEEISPVYEPKGPIEQIGVGVSPSDFIPEEPELEEVEEEEPMVQDVSPEETKPDSREALLDEFPVESKEQGDMSLEEPASVPEPVEPTDMEASYEEDLLEKSTERLEYMSFDNIGFQSTEPQREYMSFDNMAFRTDTQAVSETLAEETDFSQPEPLPEEAQVQEGAQKIDTQVQDEISMPANIPEPEQIREVSIGQTDEILEQSDISEPEQIGEEVYIQEAEEIPEQSDIPEPEHIREEIYIQEAEEIPEQSDIPEPEQTREEVYIQKAEEIPEQSDIPEPEQFGEEVCFQEAEEITEQSDIPEPEQFREEVYIEETKEIPGQTDIQEPEQFREEVHIQEAEEIPEHTDIPELEHIEDHIDVRESVEIQEHGDISEQMEDQADVQKTEEIRDKSDIPESEQIEEYIETEQTVPEQIDEQGDAQERVEHYEKTDVQERSYVPERAEISEPQFTSRQKSVEEKAKRRELIILLPEIEQLQRRSEHRVEPQPFGTYHFEQFHDKVSEVKEIAEEHVSETSERMEETVDMTSESFIDKVTEVKDGLESVRESVIDKVSEKREAEQELVSYVKDIVTEKVDTITEQFHDEVTDVEDGLESIKDSVVDRVSEERVSQDVFSASIKDKIEEKVDTVRESVSEKITDVDEGVETVKESVLDRVSEIRDAKEEFVSEVSEKAEEKIDVLHETIKETTKETDDGFESFREIVTDKFSDVTGYGESVVSETKENIETQFDTITETVDEQLSQVRDEAAEAKESVTSMFDEVKSLETDFFNNVQDETGQVQESADLFGEIKGFGADFTEDIQEKIETVSEEVEEQTTKVKDEYEAKQDLVTDMFVGARDFGQTVVVDEVEEIVVEKEDDLIETAGDKITDTKEVLIAERLVETVIEKAQERAKTPDTAYEDIHVQEGSTIMEEEEEVEEVEPKEEAEIKDKEEIETKEEEETKEEPIKPSTLGLGEHADVKETELTPTAQEHVKPRLETQISEPHECFDGPFEASVVDSIVGRVTHDFEIGTEEQMKTSTGFKIGPIEYQAADEAEESRRLAESYASSSSEHATATRTVSSESSSDTMTTSGGMAAAVVGTAVIADVVSTELKQDDQDDIVDTVVVHTTVVEEPEDDSKLEPSEYISEEEIVSEKPLEVISKDQEVQLHEEDIKVRIASEASMDRTESASIDSEDMEEPYGDQKLELEDEMSIEITPSPLPPKQEEVEEEHEEEKDELKTEIKVEAEEEIASEAKAKSEPPVQPEPVPAVAALKQMPLEPELPKEVVSISSEEMVKTSSSSDTSAEPTLLAATYDLDSGAISRVVASYDVSPDTVEKTLTVETQPKTILSSPEDDVFEADLAAKAAAAKETCVDDVPVCAEQISEIELVSVSPIPEEDKLEDATPEVEGGEDEERISSPFEVVDDSDLVGYSEYETALEAHGATDAAAFAGAVGVADLAAGVGIGIATTQIEIVESSETSRPDVLPTAQEIEPQMRQSLSLDQESPSFDHSSPISSSEPSDFRGPISPLDAPFEPLPGAIQPPVPEEIIEVPQESDAAAEPEQSYIHTNGPTEVEYIPEQDEEQYLPQSIMQQAVVHVEEEEMPQEAVLAFLPDEPREQDIVLEHVEVEETEPVEEVEAQVAEEDEEDAARSGEHLVEEPVIEEGVAVSEVHEVEPEEDTGLESFADHIADTGTGRAVEVTVADVSFHEERHEEISESQESTLEAREEKQTMDTSTEIASSEFATRSVMEDLTVTTTDKLLTSDQTLYDLDMPSDQITDVPADSAALAVDVEEEPERPPSPIQSMFKQDEAYISEIPQEYTADALKTKQEESVQEPEQPAADELVVLDDEEEPDAELEALADDQDEIDEYEHSPVEAIPDAEGRTSSGSRSDPQLRALQTSETPDFDLKSDVLDERPVSPEPDDKEQEDEKEPEAKLPEDGFASPLVLQEEVQREEEQMDTGSDEVLKVKASMFVQSVMTEATATVVHKGEKSDEKMISDDQEEEEEEPTQPQQAIKEIEVHREYSPESPSDDEMRHDIIQEEDEDMEEMAESEEVPGITVTQHLHEEVDQGDYPTSYAPKEAIEEEGARSQESDMEIEQRFDEEGDQVIRDEEDSFLDKAMPPPEEMTSEQMERESPTLEQDPFLVKGLPARVPKETSEIEGMETDYGNVVVGQVTLDKEITTQFIPCEPGEQDVEGVLDKGEMMIVDTSGRSPDSSGSVEMSDGEKAMAEELEGGAIGDKTPDLASPDQELAPAALVSDATGPFQVTTAISIDAADKLLIQPDEIQSPEDYGDSSSVDSFATVVATHEDQADEDQEDRLAEVASMTSSVHSDIHATVQDDTHQPEAPISIDVRDIDAFDEDETEKMSESSSSSEKFDVIEKGEQKSTSPEKESSEDDEESYEMIVRDDAELEALQDRSLDFMTYPRRELEGIKEESESDQRDSGEATTSSSEKLGSASHSSDRVYSSPDLPLTSPDIQGKKFFSKSGERDDVSVSSSLLEFEELEKEAAEKGSLESFTMKEPLSPGIAGLVRAEDRENVSLSSSLAEFEKIESEMIHSVSMEKVKPDSKSSEENGSMSSLAEFEKLESELKQESDAEKNRSSSDSAGAAHPLDSISLKSSNSSLSEFERLEQVITAQDDQELEEEAQKVVTLLESGALLPTDQSESDGPGESPRRKEFATLSQEQLVDPPELSRDASLDRDDLIAPVPTVPVRKEEDMDRDSLSDHEEGQKEIEEIIIEASKNVETFTEPIVATEAVRVSRQLQEALRTASIDSEECAIERELSSGVEADIDSLDGRDDEEFKKAGIVAGGIAGAMAEAVATATIISDVVPAEQITREIDADSLQGSDSQSKSGALDSDSLQDQDSVMQISAESFELDRTGASTSPLPEFQIMQRSTDSANIMDRSADSLEMDRAVAEPLNLMERSTEDSSICGIMERSIDSLELDPSIPESQSRQSFDRDSLHDTEPMTTESTEATECTQTESVMVTSADSLNEPEVAQAMPPPGVMEMSVESGAWSQSSSLISQDTLKSSGSEMYSQRDIMMVSSESPTEFEKPGVELEKLERITEHTVTTSTVQYDVTYTEGASYHVTTEEMLHEKELLDSEGNITIQPELMTLMDNQGFTRHETKQEFEEHESMEYRDDSEATPPPGEPFDREEVSGSPMDQGSESGEARAAIGQMSLTSVIRPQSEQPVQFYEPSSTAHSNLSSPSSESSHSETCYCGPAYTSGPDGAPRQLSSSGGKPAKSGGSTN